MPYTQDQRQETIDAAIAVVEAGHSANTAFKEAGTIHGVHPQTVRRWLKQAGISLGDMTTHHAKKAQQAHRAQYEERRGEVRVRMLEKVLILVERITDGSARDAKDYATAAAILVDKIRLEEGKATGRYENLDLAAAESLIDQEIERLSAELADG